MTKRILAPLILAIALGAGLGIVADVADWSDLLRNLVGGGVAAVLVAVGVPYVLARRRDEQPWMEHHEREVGLRPVQGVGFFGESAREQEWSDYWWVRMPMRWDPDQRQERLIKQTALTISRPTEEDAERLAGSSHPLFLPLLLPPPRSLPPDALSPEPVEDSAAAGSTY